MKTDYLAGLSGISDRFETNGGGAVAVADPAHVAWSDLGAPCACSACTGNAFVPPSDSVDASVDYLAGTTAANGKPIWSAEQIAAHLNRTGTSWIGGANPPTQRGDSDPTTVTFAFFNAQSELFNNGYVYQFNGGVFGLAEYFNFAPFGEAQRAAAREAMQSWDDVAAVSFVETDAANGDINFGNLASAPTTQAYARLPSGLLSSNAVVNAQVKGIAGDIWISASQASNFQLDEGGYGLQTMAHEIGHALGLSHPGAYNAAPGLSITYGANAEYYQDVRNYTIMSYFNASAIGARHFDFHTSTTAYAGSPMIHDILAIQKMYGADMTTRTGDTTYGFNSNAGRDAYDFALTPAPIITIWDAGGLDTLDASGYATNQVIDLREGSLSSIGGVTFGTAPSFEQVNANRAAGGMPPLARATYDANMAALQANPIIGQLTDNVGIAYGAVIENSVGGSGNDLMIGNTASNAMIGNAGNDTFVGGDGIDFFTGGAGADTFFAEINAFTVRARSGNLSVDVVTDFKSGIDKIDLGLIDANLNIDGQQGFVFVKNGTGNAGEIYTQTYGNVLAATKSLGISLPGYSGPNPQLGKVTVVFADVDGGGADMAFFLIGTVAVTLGDFLNLAGQVGSEGTVSTALANILSASTNVLGTAQSAQVFAEDAMDELIAAALGAPTVPASNMEMLQPAVFAPDGDIFAQFGSGMGLVESGRNSHIEMLHLQYA